MPNVDLSLVIVNWNTRDYLDACLRSLARAHPALVATGALARAHLGQAERAASDSSALSVEVLVVDNASTDGSADLVRERYPWARLFANQRNVGWAAGNNQGIRESTGRYVLLLNPDTEVEPGALEALVRFMDEHPEAAAAGPKLLNPDGTLQPSCRSFPSPEGVLWELLRLSRLFPRSRRLSSYRMSWFDYERVQEVDQPMGSALLLRRKALDQVGLMDEDFPLFFNEVDWCYRAKQAGWRIYFVPGARILHHGGQSTRQVRAEAIEESHRSMVRFYEKHYRKRIPAPLFGAITWLIRRSAAWRVARAPRSG